MPATRAGERLKASGRRCARRHFPVPEGHQTSFGVGSLINWIPHVSA